MHPLVDEAMKKAAVAWLGVPGAGGGTYPVWCLWLDGGLYVVSGAGEQPAPGLAGAGTATVTARGDHGGRIITWPASVTRVAPGGEEWERVVPQLAGKLLNAPGGPAETAARWADGCVLSRLEPAGEPVEAGPGLPTGSGGGPPVPTPAARRTAKPFRLHRVRGERRGR
jgi:hypothetical protein